MGEEHRDSCRLLDLPDELLVECLPGYPDERYCLAVCRRLLSLLPCKPTGYTPRLRLQLQKPEDVASRRASLRVAARCLPGLSKLRLELHKQAEQRLAEVLAPPEPDAGTGSSTASAGPGPAWPPGITSVELAATFSFSGRPVLNQLMPVCIAQACPNLTHLHLRNLKLRRQQHQQLQLHLHQQLQQISLEECLLSIDRQDFEQQLQMLPALAHFSAIRINYKDMKEDPEWSESRQHMVACAAAIAAAARQQLKSVELDTDVCDGEWPDAAFTALVSHSWPQLQGLHLKRVVVGDSDLDLMLQHMPQLQSLTVSDFDIRRSHTHQPCSWQWLQVQHVDVAALARLPLNSVTSLEVWEPDYNDERWWMTRVHLPDTGNLQEDLQLTAAAVAAAARCGGVDQGDATGPLVQVQPHQGPVLLAALPLLQHMDTLQLEGAHVTEQLLDALSAAMPKCWVVSFAPPCTFAPDIWGSMVRLLPNVTMLHIDASLLTMQQLGILCASATRQVKVRAVNPSQEFQAQASTLLADLGPSCPAVLTFR